MKKIIRNSRGITLIEVMIVLAILGTLLAILAPRFASQLDKANQRTTKIAMGQLMQKIAEYQLECGKVPSSLELLVTPGEECPNWIPGDFKKLPVDGWKNPFVYTVENGTFVIVSLGSDKREGGTALAADIRSDELDK